MASYIQLHMELDTRDCNPTPQQRAVYSYHEEIHSDAADDIYSFEWFQRTKLFFKQFGRPEKRVTTLKTWEMVEELDFGAFFLAHPVAAYSLWHLLQACYDLDRVVCGCSQEELAKWKAMKPFVYLRAKRIRIQWVKSLKHLKEKIECGTLEGDELVRTLYDILCGVERLVASSTTLKENFAVNLRDMIFVDQMLQKITTFVDDRCGMIAAHLKLEESQETSRQESESSNDEALDDSMSNLQNTSENKFLTIPPKPSNGPRKRPKRQPTFPKPKENEISMKSRSNPAATKPVQKYNSLYSLMEFLMYAFLLIAFGLVIYTVLPLLQPHGFLTPGLITPGGILL